MKTVVAFPTFVDKYIRGTLLNMQKMKNSSTALRPIKIQPLNFNENRNKKFNLIKMSNTFTQ